MSITGRTEGRAHSHKKQNYIPIPEIAVEKEPSVQASLGHKWNEAVKSVKFRAECEKRGIAGEDCLTCVWNGLRECGGIFCPWQTCKKKPNAISTKL